MTRRIKCPNCAHDLEYYIISQCPACGRTANSRTGEVRYPTLEEVIGHGNDKHQLETHT